MLTFAAFGSVFLMQPVGAIVLGAYIDRIGRRPVLMGITVLALLTTWPVMHWLTAAPDFTRMTLVLLWFSYKQTGGKFSARSIFRITAQRSCYEFPARPCHNQH